MKTSISVELIPRTAQSLVADAQIAANFPQITHLNIPDMADTEKFRVRSVEAARLLWGCFGDRFVYVPHVRSFDSIFQPEVYSGDIALVVGGDRPFGLRAGGEVSSVERILGISKYAHTMAGLDPYRNSPKAELAYAAMKLKVGAKGFFTQPFFSLAYLRFWDSMLPSGCEVFYGVSPVTNEKSLAYWKEKNHAVFPNDFAFSLAYQVRLAQKMIRFAHARKRSVYLMPIRTPLPDYLEKVFA